MAEQKVSDYITTLSEIEAKSHKKALSRRAIQEAEEYLMEAESNRQRELSERQQKRLAEEANYVAEMHERNRLKFIDSKRRQQIRETNQELRELESKLRAAYVSKSIRLQLAEKEAMKLEEMLNVKREQQRLTESQLAYEHEITAIKQKEKDRQIQLRKQLIEQMENKSLENQMMYKEFLQEKHKLDEIVRRIQEEQIAELQEKMFKKESLRRGLEELQRSKQIWKEQEQLQIDEENRRIWKYLQEQQVRNEEAKAVANEKLKHSFALAEKMCAELENIDQEARRREELLLALKIEELNEEAEVKERLNLERIFRRRIEMRIQLEKQKEENLERLVREKNEDAEFRANRLKLLSERDRMDEMTAEKRRRTLMQHYRAVREIMDQREKAREEEKNRLVAEHRYDLEQQDELLKIIEEERLKILKEHAAELIGYFPPGILREGDLARLNI
ncbi:Meiosis-specific nuclear structural protein 1 [Pseudolycoriella hygida]|uniref:Meiosis-specific nuclear structural protein 1 n=1 Tax=Pseudolycoriella hygida TaxID=35572 RepID=A0A9Q0MW22_9DIPT|nr:Meiosis-specific nuclear structural protein 1 [Pseudolycoriella hygida]